MKGHCSLICTKFYNAEVNASAMIGDWDICNQQPLHDDGQSTSFRMAIVEARVALRDNHFTKNFGWKEHLVDVLAHQAGNIYQMRTTYASSRAPIILFMTGIVFKLIELLFAYEIILGTSDEAWFGHPLAPLFPRQLAAGLFVIPFGQVVN
jgi:hypothetical protein